MNQRTTIAAGLTIAAIFCSIADFPQWWLVTDCFAATSFAVGVCWRAAPVGALGRIAMCLIFALDVLVFVGSTFDVFSK